MTNGLIAGARPLYWSVRRELWENRAIYLAPLATAGIVLVGLALGLAALPSRMQTALTLDPAAQRAAIEQPFIIAAIVLMAADLLVSIFYCLDALYGERRDRSILFWKSLPVSDTTAVLAKATIPILVLPFVTFAVTVATQTVMLLADTAVLVVNGVDTSALWADVSVVDLSWINFGHLVAFHGIWYAPLYAWLLLVSAWAPRLPLLWAVLPPAALLVVERIAFGSSQLAHLLQVHFLGAPRESADGMTMAIMAPDPAEFVLSAGLWLGLAISVVFLTAAVRFRRSRGAL